MFFFSSFFKNYAATLSVYNLSDHKTKPKYCEESGMLSLIISTFSSGCHYDIQSVGGCINEVNDYVQYKGAWDINSVLRQ